MDDTVLLGDLIPEFLRRVESGEHREAFVRDSHVYRRAMHYAFATAYQLALRARTLHEARELIGIGEDVAAEFREQSPRGWREHPRPDQIRKIALRRWRRRRARATYRSTPPRCG